MDPSSNVQKTQHSITVSSSFNKAGSFLDVMEGQDSITQSKVSPSPQLSNQWASNFQPTSQVHVSSSGQSCQSSGSVATSTIFSILADSTYHPNPCVKKSSSAGSSSLIKYFQSSLDNISGCVHPKKEDTSCHSQQGNEEFSSISDNGNSEVVYISSDDSDDENFDSEYMFHGNNEDDNLEIENVSACVHLKNHDTYYHNQHCNVEVSPISDNDYNQADHNRSDDENFEYTFHGNDIHKTEYFSSKASTPIDSESEKELDHCIVVYSHSEHSHLLPFPDVSPEWYERQRATEVHNATREQRRSEQAAEVNDQGSVLFVVRSCVDGALEDNIKLLQNNVQHLPSGPKR